MIMQIFRNLYDPQEVGKLRQRTCQPWDCRKDSHFPLYQIPCPRKDDILASDASVTPLPQSNQMERNFPALRQNRAHLQQSQRTPPCSLLSYSEVSFIMSDVLIQFSGCRTGSGRARAGAAASVNDILRLRTACGFRKYPPRRARGRRKTASSSRPRPVVACSPRLNGAQNCPRNFSGEICKGGGGGR